MDSDSPDAEGEDENTLNSWTKSIHHGRLSRNLLRWQYSIPLLLITWRSCSKMIPLYKRSEGRQRHKVLPIFGKMIFWWGSLTTQTERSLSSFLRQPGWKYYSWLTTLHWRVTSEERGRWRRSELGWTGQESPQAWEKCVVHVLYVRKPAQPCWPRHLCILCL